MKKQKAMRKILGNDGDWRLVAVARDGAFEGTWDLSLEFHELDAMGQTRWVVRGWWYVSSAGYQATVKDTDAITRAAFALILGLRVQEPIPSAKS